MKIIDSAYARTLIRLLIAAAVAAAISAFTIFRLDDPIARVPTETDLFFASLPQTIDLPPGWRLESKEYTEEGTRKFLLMPPAAGAVEVHFDPLDPRKPCYDRTDRHNVAYMSTGGLTEEAERALKSIIGQVREAEKHVAKGHPFAGTLARQAQLGRLTLHRAPPTIVSTVV